MTPMPYADLGNGAPGRNARAADQSRYCPRRRKPGRRGEACCTWQRLLQESMNRWACPILSEGPTTLLDESSAGSFAFLDVRYEKSENGLRWVSYGVGKDKGQHRASISWQNARCHGCHGRCHACQA